MLEYFKRNTSRLQIGGMDFEEMTRLYKTPLYVYDSEIIRAKFQRLREAMPPHVHIFYAMKSNPNLAVIRILAELGCGFDVASIGELTAIKKLAIDGARVVFTGPGKSDDEIVLAIQLGIYSFNCESENEIIRINSAAKKENKKIKIGLRVNTDYAIKESIKMIGGTQAKKFGIDENQIFDVIDRVRKLENVIVVGIHVFNAAQVLDYKQLAANTKNILRLACDIMDHKNLSLEYIDIGGGLGIPYAEGEKELDVIALGREFSDLHKEISSLSTVRWIVEPGRYLSGECGVLLTNVVDVKTSRGVRFVITDAGINNFLRPALIHQNHPVRVSNKFDHEPANIYRVEGPLCTSLDCIGMDVKLPDIEVGDTIAFFNAGAYGFSESMPYFLSHPIPAEVMIRDRKAVLVRRRIEPQEYIDHCII
ncbi:diaminopimelate decarboxylase [bacterium]|nr:MAG: diaminopimelate decarboxylase [bacterium]